MRYLIILVFLMSCSSNKEKFSNLEPFQHKSFWTLLKWKLTNKKVTWPSWVESEYGESPQKKVEKGISFVHINHSTILIQVDGLNILTDPIYAKRTSPVSFAGPKRVRNPGIRFDQLPKIDLVVISHNHYDHLDLDTLIRLHKRDQPTFAVGLKNRSLLESQGIENIVEMNWWQELAFKEIKVHFVPAQHWSARGLFDRFETLWGGFYLETSMGGIYFAGDTGYGKFFQTIKEKYGAPQLSFLPIGAYAPRWFMKSAHMNPEESVKAHIDLASKQSVGMHFGTFQLTDEGINEPHQDLKEARLKYSVSEDLFISPETGKSYIIEKK